MFALSSVLLDWWILEFRFHLYDFAPYFRSSFVRDYPFCCWEWVLRLVWNINIVFCLNSYVYQECRTFLLFYFELLKIWRPYREASFKLDHLRASQKSIFKDLVVVQRFSHWKFFRDILLHLIRRTNPVHLSILVRAVHAIMQLGWLSVLLSTCWFQLVR